MSFCTANDSSGMPTKNKRYYFGKKPEGSGKNQIMWYNNSRKELRESL
jgi:hypothetical protein